MRRDEGETVVGMSQSMFLYASEIDQIGDAIQWGPVSARNSSKFGFVLGPDSAWAMDLTPNILSRVIA